ncbi:MAG: M23 family peptidase, partial [Alphaproteobacteria bacterium]
TLVYRAGGLLGAGFAAAAPRLRTIQAGTVPRFDPAATPPTLIFWAAAWGLRTGDHEEMRLIGPNGQVLTRAHATVPGDRAEWLRYIGRPRPPGGWPRGRYRGLYRVTRTTEAGRVTITETAVEMTVP